MAAPTNDAEARALVVIYAQTGSNPVLTDGEIDALMEGARVPDYLGLYPDDDGYTLTYGLPSVIAEAWELKASKVVAQYDVKASSVDAKRSQIFNMCMARAKEWRRKAYGAGSGIGSMRLSTTPPEPLY